LQPGNVRLRSRIEHL